MPFTKTNNPPALIVAIGKKETEDEPKETGLGAKAKEFLAAIKSGDAAEVALLFRELHILCDDIKAEEDAEKE